MNKKALLIGMPGWNVDYPMHALGYVSAIFTDVGWDCTVADVNIEIFRRAAPSDRKYWNSEHWLEWYTPSFLERLAGQYGSEIEEILRGLIESCRYDICAFSVNGLTKYFTLYASRFVKSLDSETFILFGGPQCFPFRHREKFLSESGAPDLICQGEAELALPQFLREFESTGDHRTLIAGFVYRDGDALVDTGLPALPTLEGMMPKPDWRKLDLTQYRSKGHFPTFFSRGCRYRCAFCADRNDFRTYRIRDVSDLARELTEVLDTATDFCARPVVYFSDHLLNGNMDKLTELCDAIIGLGPALDWYASVKFRQEMTGSVLRHMHRSGCRRLFWGLESASQRVIDSMNKQFTLETAKRILFDAHEAGIESYLPFIVGFPGERVTDFVDSLAFALAFRAYGVFEDPLLLQVIPNSALHENPSKWNIRTGEDAYDWVSEDLRNDFSVRVFRRFVLRNVVHNSSLAMHDVVGLDDLHYVNFNHYPLASDIVALLYELWTRSGVERKMIRAASGYADGNHRYRKVSREELDYWHPENVPPDIDLRKWFGSRKNTEAQRIRIVILLFEAIRGFAASCRA